MYFRFLMQQVGSGIGDVLNSTGRKVATGMILAQVNGCGRSRAVQVTASNRYAWLCEDMAGAIVLAGTFERSAGQVAGRELRDGCDATGRSQ